MNGQDDPDLSKKESTNSGTPSTSSSKPKDVIHDDLCSICFDDVSILDCKTYFICYECGKVMHKECGERLCNTKSLSVETRFSCPMCRAPGVDDGSKEEVERLQKWSQRGKSWGNDIFDIL